MANRETGIQNEIRLAVAKAGATTFRNITAQGWAGMVADKGQNYVTIANPTPLIAGLCVGSADVIGWKPVKITKDMIDQTVAVFVALEIKTPVGRASPEQLRFIQAVQRAGGLAGFPTSPEAAVEILNSR